MIHQEKVLIEEFSYLRLLNGSSTCLLLFIYQVLEASSFSFLVIILIW